MRCPKCGAKMTDGLCPECVTRAAPENVGGYLLLPHPLFNVHRAGREAKALASRAWGSYHAFAVGKTLEAGEAEVLRLLLLRVEVFSVDNETVAAVRPLCIVTDRRIMAQDTYGHLVQVRREDISGTDVRREGDPPEGPMYFLAISRVGSDVHDLHGDVALYCRSRQDCYRLQEALS